MWAWLLLALAVLMAAGAVVAAVVVAVGGEDVAVVNTHTAEAGEPALVPVPGYAYEDLTGDDLADFQGVSAAFTSNNEMVRKSYPELGDIRLGWSGHRVVSADGEVAFLVLATINQDYLDAGVVTEKDVVNADAGAAAGEGATVTTGTIAGEKVAYAEFDGSHNYFWVRDGVEVAAFGTDEGDVRDFVDAYLEATHQ